MFVFEHADGRQAGRQAGRQEGRKAGRQADSMWHEPSIIN